MPTTASVKARTMAHIGGDGPASNTRPKVSVCLASYNGARFITRQLRSVIDQLQEGDEVIVIDDASSDDTVDRVEAIADRRIKIFRRERNGGVVAAFEDAFHRATGDVIFLSDQDDCWYRGKVEAVLSQLALGNDLVVHDAKIVTDGVPGERSMFAARRSGPGVLHNLVRNSYVGCCMAFRSTVLHDVLPVPRTKRILHDMWIGIFAEWRGWRVRFVPLPLMDYEIHDSNVSARLPLHTAILNRMTFALAFALRALQRGWRRTDRSS